MAFAGNGVPFQIDNKEYVTKDEALTRMNELKQVHEDVVMYVKEIKNN
jgi:hypothetical protein